jgi:altered-inheritance-of-mitochondria protein 13
LDRERALAGIQEESEAASGAVRSSAALSEDLEQIRSKIDRFQTRKRLETFPGVAGASETVLACYRWALSFIPSFPLTGSFLDVIKAVHLIVGRK